MEIFYSRDIEGGSCRLDPEESSHCTRVLRHRSGDEICVIDGEGTMYRCRLTDDSPKGAEALILEAFPGWGSHSYHLTVACCPTKNNERFEWFVEKATEVGVDRIVPIIGDRSERKVHRSDRSRRIALAAAKQSLKSAIPVIDEAMSVRDFIAGAKEEEGSDELRLIACCFEGETPRLSITEALRGAATRRIVVMIGPEGDFSEEEAALAVRSGFIPIHLGSSRLRTETAALTAAEAVYLANL